MADALLLEVQQAPEPATLAPGALLAVHDPQRSRSPSVTVRRTMAVSA